MPDLSAFTTYLQETKNWSPRTVLAYRSAARDFLVMLNGRTPEFSLLNEYIRTLNHGRLRPQSIGVKMAGIVSWLGFAAAEQGNSVAKQTRELLNIHPIAPAVRESDQTAVTEVTESEYREAMGQAGAEGRALLSLLWFTGARISEIVGDSVAGIPALTIEDGRSLAEEGHTLTFGKGGRRRILVLPTTGQDELRIWTEARAVAVGQTEGSSSVATAPLFPMMAGTVRRLLKSLSAGLRPHRFRHSLRARLRRAGVSDEISRALLGHGPKDTHESYGRVSIDEMKAAVEMLTNDRGGDSSADRQDGGGRRTNCSRG